MPTVFTNHSTMKPIRQFLAATFAAACTLFTAAPPLHAAPGSLDPTFGTGGVVTSATGGNAIATAIQSDGRIVVAVTTVPGEVTVTRYEANGTLDTTFGDNASGVVRTPVGSIPVHTRGLALQADGKILVGADTALAQFALVRYNNDGTLDTGFGVGGIAVTSMSTGASPSGDPFAVQTDGKIVVTGVRNNSVALVRYTTNGTLDTSFGTGGVVSSEGGYGTSVILQPNGKIVVAGGRFDVDLLSGDFLTLRFNADGSPDTTFNAPSGFVSTDFGGDDQGGSAALQSDGKIVVFGTTTGATGADFALARYNANGSLDTSFGTDGKVTVDFGGNEFGANVVVQADGKIVVIGGDFGRALVARYHADGTADASFDGAAIPFFGFGGALQADGKIVAVGGTGQVALARLLGDSLTPVEPTVTSPTSLDVTGGGATLAGEVTDDGGAVITERGVVFAKTSENGDPLIGGLHVTKVVVATAGPGVFTVPVTALTANTSYTFKAYAINSVGTGYTSTETFTTGAFGFTEDFNSPFNFGSSGGQYQTLLPLHFNADYARWTKDGQGTAHVVNRGSGNCAVMFYHDNVLKLAAGIDGSNVSGQTYTVSFEVSPAVYQIPGQATQAGDQLVVRAMVGETEIASKVVTPGAWAGNMNFHSESFTYVGNGGVDVKIEVKPADSSFNNGRFAGAIDNLTVTLSTLPPTAAAPTSTSVTATAATLGGSVTDDGGSAVTERGVIYAKTSLDNDPLLNGANVTKVVAASAGTGTFTVPVTGLSGTTGYSFKAYAINANGTAYSPVSTFNTLNSAPTVTLVGSATITVEAGGTHTELGATGEDAEDGALTPVVTGAVNAAVPGIYTLTYTVADSANATASVTRTVTVRDTTAPSITGVPANITTPATGVAGAVVTYSSPTASDIVDGPVSVTCSPVSGSTFAPGTTTVHCTATDAAGNTSSVSFTVTVVASNNANLASLSLSVPHSAFVNVGSVTLKPAFDPAVTTYTATVPNLVTNTSVSATAAFAGATITRTPTTTPVALAVGNNVIQVKVKAQDGVTQKIYTVTVKRTVVDTTKPAITILTPGAATITAPVAISGRVSEAVGLKSVTVRLNGVILPLTAPLASETGTAILWSTAVPTPENGPNTITVEALDINGNLGLATKTFTYVDPAVASLAGTYEAVLASTGTPDLDTTGLVTVTVAATGSFSGSVTISGVKVAFTGVLKSDGVARFKPSLAQAFDLIDRTELDTYLGAITLAVSEADGLEGALATDATGSTVLATFAGKVAPYTSTVLVAGDATAAAYLNLPLTGPATSGSYTVAFPSKAQTPTRAEHTYPQGAGYASLKLTNAGAVTLTGSLADGTAYSAAGKLRKDGTVALFTQLYRKGGALGGELAFNPTVATSDVSGTDLLWIRPAVRRARYYPAGWETGVRVNAIGTKYAAPVSLNFDQGPANLTVGNASLVFTGAQLVTPVTNAVSIDPVTGAVKLIPATTTNYSLGLTTSTGMFSGLFTHPTTGKETYRGILLNKGTNQGGYGYFLTTPPLSYGAVGQSGVLFLDPHTP